MELWKKEVWPRVKARGGLRGLDRLRGRSRPLYDTAPRPHLGPARTHPGVRVRGRSRRRTSVAGPAARTRPGQPGRRCRHRHRPRQRHRPRGPGPSQSLRVDRRTYKATISIDILSTAPIREGSFEPQIVKKGQASADRRRRPENLIVRARCVLWIRRTVRERLFAPSGMRD